MDPIIFASILVFGLGATAVVITKIIITTMREEREEARRDRADLVALLERTHQQVATTTRETVEEVMGAAAEALNRAVYGKEGEIRQVETGMDRWLEEGQKWFNEDVDAMGQDPLDDVEPDPILGLGGLAPDAPDRAAGLRPGQSIPGIYVGDEDEEGRGGG